MITKIIPLQRLPRDLSLFDYVVPEELEKKIKIGQLVKIPFKKSQIFGIIFAIDSLKQENKKTLKQIGNLVNEIPFLSEKQLKFARQVSQIYNLPLGSTLKMIMPPLQKRKIKKQLITTSQHHNITKQ